MSKIYSTPGVYIEEGNAFSNSVVPVATAVPAFIGYTEKASFNNKEVTHEPVRISSFAEFLQYFGEAPKTTYQIEEASNEFGFNLKLETENYLLYRSIKLFYNNGGADCYIVSIGNYETEIQKEDFFGVDEHGKSKGIDTLEKYLEPTMLIVPETILLVEKDCQEVQQRMLKHCGGDMKNRIAILDIYDGYQPRIEGQDDVINKFREGIGQNFLDFGAAYYPWLETSIVSEREVSFENIDNKSRVLLISMLKKEADQLANGDVTKAEQLKSKIDELNVPTARLHQELLAIFPLYKSVIRELAHKMNVLPPAAAMAGIYTSIDNQIGVHQSPANVSVVSVAGLTVNIDSEEQENLNLPLDGKAVNAIRNFPGKGILVWGARTLDGNSPDWRYISVRRTMIMIEQSAKNAIEAYTFDPNTAPTWENVKAMLNNFLTNMWAQGALAGATAEDAFSVDVGLGTTMTPVDVLEGMMRVTMKVAVTRPAEFIVITIEQQMQKS